MPQSVFGISVFQTLPQPYGLVMTAKRAERHGLMGFVRGLCERATRGGRLRDAVAFATVPALIKREVQTRPWATRWLSRWLSVISRSAAPSTRFTPSAVGCTPIDKTMSPWWRGSASSACCRAASKPNACRFAQEHVSGRRGAPRVSPERGPAALVCESDGAHAPPLPVRSPFAWAHLVARPARLFAWKQRPG